MDDLRQRVARGDYSVDSNRVARSLVDKMKLIQAARRRIGASPAREQRGHTDGSA
jgi:hypothetical protein